MSARKLQQEFDKINKKISEGLTAFDETYEKLVSPDVGQQREKLENDLKKEIKKLQKLRDQLKQWLSDSSIKLDKNSLQENRTKIEHAMDQFKDLEKISKIKQFSNEGLELQSQRRFNKFGGADDSKKAESCTYISDIIDQLNQQNETLDLDIISLTQQLKKNKNTAGAQKELEFARESLARNKSHVERLEEVLHNLETDLLAPEKIDEIKDDLDYYVENNQEEDYVEYDDFYDQLKVDEGLLAQMAVEAPREKKEDNHEHGDQRPKEQTSEASAKDSAKDSAKEPSKEPSKEPAKDLPKKLHSNVVKAPPPGLEPKSSTASPIPRKSTLPSVISTFGEGVTASTQMAARRLQHPLPFAVAAPMLETSLLNCPDSFDAEKPRQYHPLNTHPSLVDYPQEPMYELNLSHIMKKFDNDTLFFCFYYLEGSNALAKWNAARELSKRGWVFHHETKQWHFPEKAAKSPTPSGDATSYKYFDYEKTWLTRRKENFDFPAELREVFQ